MSVCKTLSSVIKSHSFCLEREGKRCSRCTMTHGCGYGFPDGQRLRRSSIGKLVTKRSGEEMWMDLWMCVQNQMKQRKILMINIQDDLSYCQKLIFLCLMSIMSYWQKSISLPRCPLTCSMGSSNNMDREVGVEVVHVHKNRVLYSLRLVWLQPLLKICPSSSREQDWAPKMAPLPGRFRHKSGGKLIALGHFLLGRGKH